MDRPGSYSQAMKGGMGRPGPYPQAIKGEMDRPGPYPQAIMGGMGGRRTEREGERQALIPKLYLEGRSFRLKRAGNANGESRAQLTLSTPQIG